jgi:hypothetical protein
MTAVLTLDVMLAGTNASERRAGALPDNQIALEPFGSIRKRK